MRWRDLLAAVVFLAVLTLVLAPVPVMGGEAEDPFALTLPQEEPPAEGEASAEEAAPAAVDVAGLSQAADVQLAPSKIILQLDAPTDMVGRPAFALISEERLFWALSLGKDLGGPDNLAVLVESTQVDSTLPLSSAGGLGQMLIQTGKARVITIQNGDMPEDALYDYVVVIVDRTDLEQADVWSLTLLGDGQLFDNVTFSGSVVNGNLVVVPR